MRPYLTQVHQIIQILFVAASVWKEIYQVEAKGGRRSVTLRQLSVETPAAP